MTDKRQPTSRFEILPAIDLQGGRVVRLVRGDRRSVTTYAGSAPDVADAFVRRGARWLHVAAIVERVGERAHVEVAGGLRDEEDVAATLRAGAARVVLGTAALRDPALVGRLVRRLGAEQIAVALDVRGGLAVGGGWVPGAEGVPVTDALERLANAGGRVFEVIALLGALVGRGRGELIASAGVASAADIRALRGLGCAGAIVGRALYEGPLTLEDALAEADRGAAPGD
jgi:phosphoribosylformimino-5-aminoimidazole carboxamide ribonucleotide (ProFAR) isomerase